MATSASTIIAAIDIGSSAIRMDVAEVRPEGSIHLLDSLKKGVQLGKDAFTEGYLSEEAIRAACALLRDFKKVMDSYGVSRYRAVATSAVRESSNSDTFLDRVLMNTGLDVEVIDGPEENRLTYAAVLESIRGIPELDNGPSLLVEIGGAFARRGAASVGDLPSWFRPAAPGNKPDRSNARTADPAASAPALEPADEYQKVCLGQGGGELCGGWRRRSLCGQEHSTGCIQLGPLGCLTRSLLGVRGCRSASARRVARTEIFALVPRCGNSYPSTAGDAAAFQRDSSPAGDYHRGEHSSWNPSGSGARRERETPETADESDSLRRAQPGQEVSVR